MVDEIKDLQSLRGRRALRARHSHQGRQFTTVGRADVPCVPDFRAQSDHTFLTILQIFQVPVKYRHTEPVYEMSQRSGANSLGDLQRADGITHQPIYHPCTHGHLF